MRILLAEDSPRGGNRNRLQVLLEMVGHSRALSTHTICPECAQREFGTLSRPAPRERNLDARA